MENKIKKRIFIVGCPRSGTTLLQNLLYNIEGSFPMPETYFFQSFVGNNYVAPRSLPPFAKFKYPKQITADAVRRVVRFNRRDSMFQMSKDQENDLIKKAEEGILNIVDFFDAVTLSYGRESVNKSAVIEKTPIHTFHLAYIKKIFPDAIYINIVRDPRDVFASFSKMIYQQKGEKRSIAEFCHLWNNSIDAGRKNNIDTIKYEDLIKNPIHIINSIISKHGFRIESINKNSHESIIRPGEIWRENTKKEVMSDNCKKYKNKLSPKQIALIEYYCKERMEMYGYEKEEYGRDALFLLKDQFNWIARKTIIYLRILLMRFKKYK